MVEFDAALRAAAGLDDIYPVLTNRHFTAGWHKARPSLWREPNTPFSPMLWKYAEAAQLMDISSRWIGTELAERRNLLMFNPVGDNDYASLPTLVAAYQMIKPGEHARAHRHSPNALRLVLDSADEVFTVVDGVELPMQPWDILLTPGWTWHSHYNKGETHNAYWIDILDVPLVHRLESMFFEPHPTHYQTVTEQPLRSSLRFSMQDQLALAPRGVAGHFRIVMEAPSLPTMTLALHTLSAGMTRSMGQVAANRIFAVIEGSGNAIIDDAELSWNRGDVFIVPVWKKLTFESSSETRLFEVSDEKVHRALGLYRETK